MNDEDFTLITDAWSGVNKTVCWVRRWDAEGFMPTAAVILMLAGVPLKDCRGAWNHTHIDDRLDDPGFRRKLRVMAGPYSDFFIRKKMKELGFVCVPADFGENWYIQNKNKDKFLGRTAG